MNSASRKELNKLLCVLWNRQQQKEQESEDKQKT